MAWNDLWYNLRKRMGWLSNEEQKEETASQIRASLPPILPFDLKADMAKNPLKYGVPMQMNAAKITQGPANIPGPHPKPKKEKLKPRSIMDDWEVTQDQNSGRGNEPSHG